MGDTAIAAPAEGLEAAYITHKDRLLTLATAIVGDRAAAEDVLHDVFAGIARDREALSPRSLSGAYLTVATRNRAISLLRSRKVQNAYIEGEARRRAPGMDGPAEAASRAEEDEALMNLVSALPDELRRVLALRIWGEFGFAEIAEAENVSKSTARMRYVEALNCLKVRLGGSGIGRHEAR